MLGDVGGHQSSRASGAAFRLRTFRGGHDDACFAEKGDTPGSGEFGCGPAPGFGGAGYRLPCGEGGDEFITPGEGI